MQVLAVEYVDTPLHAWVQLIVVFDDAGFGEEDVSGSPAFFDDIGIEGSVLRSNSMGDLSEVAPTDAGTSIDADVGMLPVVDVSGDVPRYGRGRWRTIEIVAGAAAGGRAQPDEGEREEYGYEARKHGRRLRRMPPRVWRGSSRFIV